MAVNLSPVLNGWQIFTNNGIPANSGIINTYQAGTTTPLGTFQDNLGAVPNSNPILLDPDGRLPGEVWLTSGAAYKFVVTDANLNVLFQLDNISGIGSFNDLVVNGNLTVLGNTALGDNPADTLAVSSTAVSWPGNPTHSGNHVFSGNVTTSGNSLVSGTSSLNKGSQFGNVTRADTSTLDWYLKEQTFTPTLFFGGASVGITYNVLLTSGIYSRIGNQVSFSIEIVLTNKGASVGDADIRGLPVASSALGPTIALANCDASAMAGLTGSVHATMSAGGSVINLRQWVAGGTTTVTDANFTNTTTFLFSGRYFA